MAKPANVMTTAPAEDELGGLARDELMDIAKAEGADLSPGYNSKDELKDAIRRNRVAVESKGPPPVDFAPGEDLEATEKFIAPGQPEHRYDANVLPPPAEGVTYLTRSDLMHMAKGGMLEIKGLKLAAAPGDFPPPHKVA